MDNGREAVEGRRVGGVLKEHRSERNKAEELEAKTSISDFTKKSYINKVKLVVKCLGSLSLVKCLAKEKPSVRVGYYHCCYYYD